LTGYNKTSKLKADEFDVETILTTEDLKVLMSFEKLFAEDEDYPVEEPLYWYLQENGVELSEDLEWEFTIIPPEVAVDPRQLTSPPSPE
jgi:hypothetical protein